MHPDRATPPPSDVRILIRTRLVVLGEVQREIAERIQENIQSVFQEMHVALADAPLPLPSEAFSKTRHQYRSDMLLELIRRKAVTSESFDRFLGIVDVDIFVPRMNFVFGEAECPGKAAVVSLWRLKPEFYKRPPSMEVLVERGTKEAVHELGHTFGLGHCLNPFCVMYFSNSIFETDRKQSLLCSKCHMKVEGQLENRGEVQ